jgi:hypothetical protein
MRKQYPQTLSSNLSPHTSVEPLLLLPQPLELNTAEEGTCAMADSSASTPTTTTHEDFDVFWHGLRRRHCKTGYARPPPHPNLWCPLVRRVRDHLSPQAGTLTATDPPSAASTSDSSWPWSSEQGWRRGCWNCTRRHVVVFICVEGLKAVSLHPRLMYLANYVNFISWAI